jgi:VWFA-related protein
MEKKFIIPLLVFLVASNIFSQIDQHEVTVRNIIVPVRVYDKNNFVDNLTIEDFELYEDGVLQKIEALHLTDKTQLSRAEGAKGFIPQVARNYYLLFQLIDYNPKLGDAFDYFFSEVMLPEDNLTIMTPVKNYTLPKGALKKYSRDEISKDMNNIVRKDVKVGSSNYRSVFRDLKRIVQSISGSGEDVIDSAYSLEFLLPRYREALKNMEELRVVDEKLFLMFAQQLKRIGGQKIVFFFYQREFRPEISGNVYNLIQSEYQERPNILAEINDLFAFYRRDTTLNAERIKQAFADSSLDFYFLFMDRRPESAAGIIMREQSEDVFSTFSEVTKATGGLIRTSQNPAMGFKNVVTACESCYFLFYSPKDYKKDGKFKEIEVRVKNKKYSIKHRSGYIAD